MLKLPEYHKVAQILLGVVGLVFILYIGQSIIIPIVLALILSILLNPLVNFMHRIGLNRVLSIILSIVFLLIVIAGIMYFVASQMSHFADAWPELKKKGLLFFERAVSWTAVKFRIPEERITTWIMSKRETGLETAGAFVGSTLIGVTGVLVMVFLIPVYIFLFLFYKPLLLDFCARAFKSDNHSTVADVLFNTKTLVQSYLVGLLIEMVIVSILNSTALLIIGVDYAIVLGVIGALLNLIPYVGGIIAIALPMLMALITGSPTDALFVLGAYMVVQLIDNNFLVPVIVASKVQINALISIIVVLVGGAIWGVAGMFLAIPLTAIAKVICDRVEPMKPLGFLIGDSMPRIGEDIFKLQILQRAYERKKRSAKLLTRRAKN